MGHIAFFVPQFIAGGVQRTTLTLCSALVERGWRVDLLIIEGSEFLKETPNAVRVVDLSAPSLPMSVFPLARFIRNECPDFLIASMPQVNIVSVVARALSRSSRTRLVLTEVSHFSSWQHFFPSLKMSLIRRLMRLTYPRADALVCLTRAIADDLQDFIKLASVEVRVIPSPVDCCAVATRGAASVDDLYWWDDEGSEVVSTLARLDPVKDLSTLIRAFKTVVQQRPTARLLVIGTGSERESLGQLVSGLEIEDHVHFTGYVAEPYPLIARSRVFALSSLIEGFPTAIVEALALGVAVVSTDCLSGPREILGDGRYGALVPVGDPDAFATALLNVLLHSDGLEVSERRRRADEFGGDRAAARFQELLTTLSAQGDM